MIIPSDRSESYWNGDCLPNHRDWLFLLDADGQQNIETWKSAADGCVHAAGGVDAIARDSRVVALRIGGWCVIEWRSAAWLIAKSNVTGKVVT